MRKKSLTKIQVQENTVLIAKFAVQLLILILLIGVIIYSTILILTPLKNPESHTGYKVIVCMTIET